MADDLISQDDYRENVEANNGEIDELVQKKNEILSEAENESAIDNLSQLKEELLQFLNFDELTTEILNRFVHKIVVSDDGIPIIHYTFSTPKFE